MKNARKSVWRYLYKSHRYTGLAIALFVVMLAVSGLFINHTSDLKLEKHFVSSPLILIGYGIKEPTIPLSYPTEQHWFTQLDNQVFMDRKVVLYHTASLQGAVQTGTFIALAFTDNIIMLTPEGEIIEQMTKPVTRIGKTADGHIYISSANKIFYSDDDLFSWQENPIPETIFWSAQKTLPRQYRLPIQQAYRAHIISYQQLLLDLHSGRLFGRFGVILVDLTGILIVFLALTGCWIWLRHKLRQRKIKPNGH